MKRFSTLLAAALFAASCGAQAQSTPTTSATPAVAKPETTAPTAAAGATVAPADGAAATSPAEPTLSPAAMRARGMTAHGARGSHAAPAAKTVGFKDGVIMHEGKVVATESGRSTFLTDSMTVKLMTGLEATGAGLVTRPDGTSETLKEGDYISLTGRLTTAEDRTNHAQSLKENLKTDRKIAAKKARSPLRQL